MDKIQQPTTYHLGGGFNYGVLCQALRDAMNTLGQIDGDLGTYTDRLSRNRNDRDALNGLSQSASKALAANVSVQSVTCDSQSNEFLQHNTNRPPQRSLPVRSDRL
jgi:hypothetical protein